MIRLTTVILNLHESVIKQKSKDTGSRKSSFPILNLNPKYISLKSNGKDVYFTDLVYPFVFSDDIVNRLSVRYLSPEVIHYRDYLRQEKQDKEDNKETLLLTNDVWSLGCLTQELFFGLKPFYRIHNIELITQILRISPEHIFHIGILEKNSLKYTTY